MFRRGGDAHGTAAVHGGSSTKQARTVEALGTHRAVSFRSPKPGPGGRQLQRLAGRRKTARDYWIMAEAEESRPNREWPKRVAARGLRPKGPSIRVALHQTGVRTSADFDWDHLLRIWPQMSAHCSDWITNKPRPRAAHDKAGDRAPAHGRGAALPRNRVRRRGGQQARVCMFGARFQLPPDVRLSEVVAELGKTAQLVHQLAQIQPR